MKATVHSVLFLCALCVLIWGGVSIAAQDKEPVVTKAEAARTAVNAAKVLGDKLKEVNKDFSGNITEISQLFTNALTGVDTALTAAGLITDGSPSRDDVERNINAMKAKITEAQVAVNALPNAEAESLKDTKKTDITQQLDAVETTMKSAEDAAKAMTDDDTSISDVIQKAERLKNAAEAAVAFWSGVGTSVTPQKNAVDAAVTKIETAITEVTESIKYVGGSNNAKAVEAKNSLETAVKVKIQNLLEKARNIQAASLEANNNAQAIVGKYGTVKTAAGELKQAAEDKKQDVKNLKGKGGTRKTSSGSQMSPPSFSTGPLLSITFPVLFLCLCVLPLQW